MSGAEHTDIGSAQFSVKNEDSVDSVDCSDTRFQLSDTSNLKRDGNPQGAESVPNLFSESSEKRISDFSSNVVGGVAVGYNCDVVNSIQAFEEGIDIFGTGFQDSEPPALGNSMVKSYADQYPDSDIGAGNNVEEQLPVSGGESVTCDPENLGDEKIPGIYVDEVGAAGGVPHVDGCENCCEAGKDGGGSSKGNDKESPGVILSPQKCENKILEPLGVASWASICEAAKESEESARFVLTEDEQLLFQKSDEADEQAQPQDLNGVLPSPVTATGKVVSETNFSDIVLDTSRTKQASKTQGVRDFTGIHIDQSEQKEKSASKAEEDGTKNEKMVLRSLAKLAERLHGDVVKTSIGIVEDKAATFNVKSGPDELSRPPLGNLGETVRITVLGLPANDGTEKPGRFRTPANGASKNHRIGQRPVKDSATTEKRTSQRLSVSSARVLRSGSQKAVEPIANLEQAKGSSAGRRRRRKGEVKEKSLDEFSKMRKHLRYLLHRISCEQNLLDAYSSEGWRGQSLEKLRPEKELQRAKADINRSKLKIRALFQRLDSISAEGKFPDSLYDSEGLIDSEDIFCAKCGSKDLPTGNDIVLCDGICDRGFHQYCLVPPLRSEEIPPGDEGWLCPACDCRADCIDLLNDSQGGKLSIEDSWEKIFPEAVTASTGHEQDDLMGLPSDDSEDYDYNPESHEDDSKVEGRESSSDESDSEKSDSSDFSSVSEELGAARADDQYLGLPSDDSEDNDFDPDAPNANDDDCESSSSDFTSASEDLGATLGNDRMSDNDEPSVPVDLEKDLADLKPLSGRRRVERLDYKKLYDEEYGNAVSDSSDDEEWAENAATRKRKKIAEKNVSANVNENVPPSADSTNPAVTPRTRGRSKRNHQAAASPSAEQQKTPHGTSPSSNSKKRPPYNKLEESITQRLLQSFLENQYPDRSTKEKLAEELGLTPSRIDKWFGHARWTHRHHPSRMEASIARVLPHSSSPQTGTNTLQGGGADASKSDIKGSAGEMSTQSRKRKKKLDDEPVVQHSKMKTPNKSPPTHASSAPVSMDTANESTVASPLSAREAEGGRVRRKTRSSGL